MDDTLSIRMESDGTMRWYVAGGCEIRKNFNAGVWEVSSDNEIMFAGELDDCLDAVFEVVNDY